VGYPALRRNPPTPARCTFERIYFSRGNSPNIYQERQHLGRLLANEVFKRLSDNLTHVVYTYVPNTSETAFLGLIQEMARLYAQQGHPLRAEKLIWKDTEGRTFIASPTLRKDLSTSAYDVVLGIVQPEDTLVCIDDSIVRGTTLRQTLLPTLARLRPARLLFLSSAPQIRYPDFYGIDMSSLEELIAFQAVIALLKESHQTDLLEHTYHLCKRAEGTDEFIRPTSCGRFMPPSLKPKSPLKSQSSLRHRVLRFRWRSSSSRWRTSAGSLLGTRGRGTLRGSIRRRGAMLR
jgi:amidophosphoribosyltransferase